MRSWLLLTAAFFLSQGGNKLGALDVAPPVASVQYGTCTGDGVTRGEAFAEARSRVPVGAVVYNRHFIGGSKYWWFKLWWRKGA